ncbi:TonB-dependent receptor [Terriglobus saanensis]|uniref:TonB-dependent receptor plug n=1 Tax=Terriglobus saanensis (strain ATCC BAA-1853 / DSM 23119 / SP1PR4) TaxID=401053 RepID=E8V708_TERSS|nr:TonB-dependent receptor [Terriglobus saanensis]ADV81648.1 TonB-dependent receptor plug [Terriglobus saanensis SP1PR4]
MNQFLTRSMSRWQLLVMTICLLFGTTMMQAQFESASVLGYVRDNAGAAVPNAQVTLTNVATNIAQTAKTDGEGKYEFNSVQIGNYVVTTSATGFEGAKTETFNVQTNARQRVDVAVKPGSVATVVEVTSAAQLLETETSSRGQVIGTREVENLPLNGRSYADLVLLVPGARKSTLENQTASSREGSFNINGQRSAFNNFLLDGLDNNNYGTSNQGFENENISPSPDAVNEFRVETNNYSAEYGRASGAVINVSTRRGTNAFHGRAWDYLRNTNLNAIGPFPPNLGVKPVLIRNQFGGTFGGPIFKDRTFFFADYEGLRQIFRNPTTAVTLPNAEQRAGSFVLHRVDGTTAPIPLYNPITGTIFANGTVTAQSTAFARAVLAALPANTSPLAYNTFSNNFVASPRGTINDDKGDVRIDHTFNQKWSAFARYSEHQAVIFDPPTVTGRAGGNANSNVNIQNRQIAGGLTWVISSNKLLDVRFAYTRNIGAKSPFGQGDSSLLTENGITDGLPTDPSIVRDLNGQSIQGFTQLGAQTSSPQFQNPTIYNPKANFTYVKGKHSMKIGYEYQAVNTQVNDFNPSYGQDNYASLYSTGPSSVVAGKTVPFFSACTSPTATGCIPTDTATGNTASTQIAQAQAAADFLFGNRSSYSLTNFTVVNLRQRFNFMYFQDDMKLMPNLTINAGLRYELATPQWERDNKLANFDPNTKSLIQAKSGSIYDRALVHMPLTNFGPRIGFSYSPLQKTVFRGGYGIAYTQFNRAGGENNLTYNGPNVVNATVNNFNSAYPTTTSLCTNDTQDQTACFRQTQQGYSNILVNSANFNPLKVTSRYIAPNFKTGYVQSYHLGFQTQLPGGIVADIAYVGNKGTHLQVLADYNQATPCLAATLGACTTISSYQARRPVPTFGDIEIAYGAGSSNYNSLQAKLEKRAGALYVLNSFTYSRTYDISSGHLETANGDNSRVNYANPSNDYGPSGYDQPLSDTTSIVYDLPYGHGRRFGASSNALSNAVLGGWQLTTINTMTSGLPVNINYSTSSSNGTTGMLFGTDLVTYRPQHIAGTPVYGPASGRAKTATALTGFLPLSSYALPSFASFGNTSPYGNVSRNSVRSYAFFQTDIGLHKAFPLWNDHSNLDFRAEAFNILNKVNYGAPDGNISDGSGFGAITTAYPARQLQLAAKFIF